MTPSPPRDRKGFEIALICALPLEARYVQGVFDKFWEEDGKQYGKFPGDHNEYTTGAIGEFNVVLAHMPGMGKVNAASVASSLRISFTGIKLAIVVGVCGGAPVDRDGVEILLGDVIISQRLVQYDFGRQYPGAFERKDTLEDAPGRLPSAMRSLLAKAQAPHDLRMMRLEVAASLQSLRASESRLMYPGIDADNLYEPTYLHKHHHAAEQDPVCAIDGKICGIACQRTCDQLGCDRSKIVSRHRLQAARAAAKVSATDLPAVEPMIHSGIMGSADTVLKSGTYRDHLAATENIIAFEMEGAGVWEHFPSIVIKGVCDYSDSHKNKDWQDYAAATAACCMKALLNRATPEDRAGSSVPESGLFWHVPFDRLPSIVGREKEIYDLRAKLFETENQRVAVCGLGGVGKSRIAWEMASYARSCPEPYSVFWIQASSKASFEKDILEIGRELKIPAFDDNKLDRGRLFKQYLEGNFAAKFLLVLDSADDEAIWCPPIKGELTTSSLLAYIPKTTTGSVLVTTRSQRVAARLVKKDIIHLKSLEPAEAVKALHSLMPDEIGYSSSEVSLHLVEKLSYLPLAIVQAAAYMNMNGVSIRDYSELLHDTREEGEIIELLGKDFEDESRYQDAQDSIASTWLISFKQLQLHHTKALEYLSFMSCLGEKDIPQVLLPDLSSKAERMESIGILRAYSFIQVQSGGDFQASLYSMHRLVRLAMRNWLRSEGSLADWNKTAIVRVNDVLDEPEYENRDLWALCFQHVQILCKAVCDKGFEAKYRLMSKIGAYLYEQGVYRDSVTYLSNVTSWREEILGYNHETTLEAYADAGRSLCANGDLEKAEGYCIRSYEGRLLNLGAEHPDTLLSMGLLVTAYFSRGKLDKSEALGLQAVEICKRVLGIEHPTTLHSLVRLATVYSERRQFDKAGELTVQALDVHKRVLGTKHPDTLTTMSALASVYFNTGQLDKSEELEVEVLEAREKVLGLEHPDTVGCLDNLASIYYERKQLDRAQELEAQVLETRKRLLGVEHPDTLTSMSHLGQTYYDCDLYTKAEALEVEVLNVRKRVLGVNHPDTLLAMHNLAYTWYEQDRHNEAVKLMASCVEISKTVWGPDHPETKKSTRSYDDWTVKSPPTQSRRFRGIFAQSDGAVAKLRQIQTGKSGKRASLGKMLQRMRIKSSNSDRR